MRLTELKLENFRCYARETSISFDRITAIIGKNDAGKSTILDALDIFFNDALIDLEDCSKSTRAKEIKIACVFDDLPAEIIIDRTYKTTLDKEFITRSDGKLEIVKTL